MEMKSREDLLAVTLQPKAFIETINKDKVRMSLAELDMLVEEYDREMAIAYVGNYATNRHLCTTVLRGYSDDELLEIMADIREVILAEIENRKNSL